MKLELRGVCKRFGETVACENVNLDLRSGEVLALLGENGAGKSTLMKILYGMERADAGELLCDGRRVLVNSPRAARALGIGMVFQQFSSIPAFTVAENLSLGAPKSSFFWPMRGRAQAAALLQLRQLLPDLDPETRVSQLGVGERQLLELAKALARGARVLLLDEPTSVLPRPDAERLWQRVRELSRAGQTVVLITHKLDDVAACADRVVVLRAGSVVHETRDVADREQLVRAMLGGAAPELSRPARRHGATRLEVRALGAEQGGIALGHLDFEVRQGEVLGIAGVTGNGQELLSRVLSGVVPARSGSVRLDGREVRGDGGSPEVAYLPEQPLLNGVAGALSVQVNLRALDVRGSPFWLQREPAAGPCATLMERFDVRPRELQRPAATLSGGNVQKLVVARELSREPSLVIACFPTMGLDVAAAAAVLTELLAAAARGASVVWISEDLDALLKHADRIAVLYQGKLRGPVPAAGAHREQLGAWMTGAAA